MNIEKYLIKTEKGFLLSENIPDQMKFTIQRIFDEFDIGFEEKGSDWIWQQILHVFDIPLIDPEKTWKEQKRDVKDAIMNIEWEDVGTNELLRFVQLPYSEKFLNKSIELIQENPSRTEFWDVPRLACALAQWAIIDWLDLCISKKEEEEE